MRMAMAALLSVAMLATACVTREPTSGQQARIRNQPPASCTQEELNACPALTSEPCADGTEPVIDYSSDCCPHFSCQPVCVAAQPCPMGPAPTCPPDTTLWIGTALEDCCPAYRCESTTECTSSKSAVCPLAFPYCGDGVQPVEVGKTADCCPIYQCPCDVTVGNGGTLADDAPQSEPALCGCTYPVCYPGEELQCSGSNQCGYPCVCVPVAAQCQTDADCPQYDCGPTGDCGVQMRCDTSMCLPSPACDPTTGATCTTECWGVCVGNTTVGCKSDGECPVGQRCEMMCAGWACAHDPSYPTDCACPPDLGTCTCDAAGNCTGSQCTGQCVPSTVCNGTCASPACTNPVQSGTDECGCPVYECTTCAVPQGGYECPLVGCYCAQQVGLDPATCCPIFYCPPVTPPEACPTAPAPLCDADGSCPAGSVCVNGVCADATSAGT
jgi:hypothetical protein